MIKINITDEENLYKWYENGISPIIKSKSLSAPTNSLMSDIYNELSNLTDQTIHDILCIPCEELCNRKEYEWIKKYVLLCDFCSQYSELSKKVRELHLNKRDQLKIRKDYFNKYKGNYVSQLMSQKGISESTLLQSWKNMDKFVTDAKNFLKKMNDKLISKKFSYDMITPEIRGELVKRFNVPVCPYCNKQYIQIYEKKGSKRYLGDIDHFLAKSTYTLFSMSIWNLVPSCKSCNQSFKNFSHKQLLNPWFSGFDDYAGLHLYYKDARAMIGLNDNMDMKWEVEPYTPSDINECIQNNIELFCLNETYEFHKKDIQLALYNRFIYSKNYFSILSRLLGIKPQDLSYEKIIYGASLDKLKFQEESLAKAIYDAVLNN